MSSRKRWWVPRYSLRTFVIMCAVVGCGAAWVSYSYRAYLAEQAALQKMVERTAASSFLSVQTRGKVDQLAGSLFL